MKFYTSFFSKGSKLFVRGYDEGSQFFERHALTPTLYIPTQAEARPGTPISFYGDILKPVDFSDVWDARRFIKDNKDLRIFGYPNYEYTKIDELFGQEFDTNLLKVCTLDIETYVGEDCDDDRIDNYTSFPDITDPHHAISVLTFVCEGVAHVYTTDDKFDKQKVIDRVNKEFVASKTMKIEYDFQTFRNEKLMMATFVLMINKIRPDIITGWNTNGFDIPYICTRTTKILGEGTINKLSPFGEVSHRWFTNKFGEQSLEYKIEGVELLDYIELYKKFELSPRANYKLETIAQIEIGQGKLAYEGSFQNFYRKEWAKFIAYNIVDVLAVIELDNVLGFIDVAASMAHSSKCVYTDVFRVTRIWDNIIANYCRESNVQVPTVVNNQRVAFEGAFVKPVIPGKYPWIASFDIASLYPSIIMEQNISPETILPVNEFLPITAKEMTDFTGNYDAAIKYARERDATLCANGALFSRKKVGTIPALIEVYMKGRKADKGEMFNWDRKLQYAKARLNKL